MPKVLDDLATEVSEITTVAASATALINGFAQRVQDAIAAAVKNGATEEQLAPVQSEVDSIKASREALSAAVLANTPAPAPTT